MYLLKQYLLITIASLILSSSRCFSQTIINIDSLTKTLKEEKIDTFTIHQYLKKLQSLQNEDISAKEVIYNWIVKNCTTTSTEYLLVQTLQTQARNYIETGEYIKATELYNKALTIGSEEDYCEIKCDVLLGLGNVFYHTEQFDKEAEYNQRSLILAQKHNYRKGIGNAKLQLASDLVENDNQTSKDTFNLVFKMMNECLNLWTEIKDTSKIIHTFTNIGQYYADYKQFDSALNFMKKAESYLSKFKYENIDFYYFILGKIYHQRGINNQNNRKDFEEAINNFKKCLPIAIQKNNKKREAWCYDWLANTYGNLGNYEQAYKYLEKHSYLYGSIVAEDNFKELSNVEHKYEVEKKQKEIISLNSINEKKTTLNKILFVSAGAILLIGILAYRNFRTKQKLQQSKISELEKDKQLSTIDAMLQGQEEERSRIAKDLHDGIGGMLSGTKLSFENMKESLILTPENIALFNKSLNMLDNSISDLRKVAHNLMPEALVKFGLQDSVRDFCISLQSSTKVNIAYQPIGNIRKLSNTAEVFTYRIIQELVNNAIKHANASQILVQLSASDDKLIIAVEDNGKGFDINSLNNSKGAGMDNIKYRVQYFNGTIDTVTSAGNGTSVNIELNI